MLGGLDSRMPLTPPPGLSARPTLDADLGDLADPPSPGCRSAAGDYDAGIGRSPVELVAEIHALRGMVASLPLIERAKGAVMLYHGLSADAAFELLHACAERDGVSVRDLADRLTAALTVQTPLADGRPVDRFLSDLADRPGLRKRTLPPQHRASGVHRLRNRTAAAELPRRTAIAHRGRGRTRDRPGRREAPG